MVKPDGYLWPPAQVAGMTVLNKDLFKKEVVVAYFIVENLKLYNLMPIVRPHLMKLIDFKPVRNIPNETKSQVYLSPDKIQKWEDFTEIEQEQLDSLDLSESDLMFEQVQLTYQNYYADTILKAILPKDQEGMSSYTKVGHIVQVNLREHLAPFKKVIGEILYEKVPNTKSVVNKVNTINNTFRFFDMEVLKGDTNMLTAVHESHCKFEMDFSKVYWNSRLQTEHLRVVKKFRFHNVLFDVFAGIGPFSIPAAKSKVTVFANDLNPESYKWLNHNRTLNKVPEDAPFSTYNLDGRDFIKTVFKEKLPQFLEKNRVWIIMNLPGMATEFLDAFVGLFKTEELPEDFKPPILFVYCFTKGTEDSSYSTAKQLVIDGFKAPHLDIESKITDFFDVRTVSSYKEMIRVTVFLDRDILWSTVAMGKNKKSQKSKNTSLHNKKANKSKAKIVKSQLKNIKIQTTTKLDEVNKTLDQLGAQLRSSSDLKQSDNSVKSSNSKLPGSVNDDSVKSAQLNDANMEMLDSIQLASEERKRAVENLNLPP